MTKRRSRPRFPWLSSAVSKVSSLRSLRLLRVAKGELGILVGLLLLAVIVLAFAALADETLEGDTRSFDRKIMLAMRNADDPANPIGPRWFEEGARDITSLGSTGVLALVSLGVVGFLALAGARGAAVLVLTSVGGGFLFLTLLKSAFARPRPDVVPHAVQIFSSSFPSGHAALSAITYLTLGVLLARVQPHGWLKAYLVGLAVTLTFLVGTSRVYLGVHWPTDVLAGWCIGSAWAIGCWVVALILQRRGQVERDVEGHTAK